MSIKKPKPNPNKTTTPKNNQPTKINHKTPETTKQKKPHTYKDVQRKTESSKHITETMTLDFKRALLKYHLP